MKIQACRQVKSFNSVFAMQYHSQVIVTPWRKGESWVKISFAFNPDLWFPPQKSTISAKQRNTGLAFQWGGGAGGEHGGEVGH